MRDGRICRRCDGTGTIPDNGEGEAASCPDCEGTGEGEDAEQDAAFGQYEKEQMYGR